MQSNTLYRQVLITQLNHLTSLAKWLSVRFRTKCFWVLVCLQPLNLRISSLFQTRNSLTFSNFSLNVSKPLRYLQGQNPFYLTKSSPFLSNSWLKYLKSSLRKLFTEKAVKRCSQEKVFYRRTPMSKCCFNKVAKQLY